MGSLKYDPSKVNRGLGSKLLERTPSDSEPFSINSSTINYDAVGAASSSGYDDTKTKTKTASTKL